MAMRGQRTDSVTGPALDARAIGAGALVALAITVPVGIAARVLDARDVLDVDSSWVFAFLALIVVGLGLGGYIAARRQPAAPLANGAVAALVALVVVQLIGIVRQLADGEDVRWLAVVFAAVLAGACGVVGGLVASSGAHRRREGLVPHDPEP